MKFGLDPVGHVSPTPPIDIAPRVPITQDEQIGHWQLAAAEDEAQRKAREADRVWALVKATAEGTNVPSSSIGEGLDRAITDELEHPPAAIMVDEAPKAWPDYAAVYDGVYAAPDYDPA